MVLFPVPLSPYTTVLSPSPKSIVISLGMPRNACITRRWSFSFTGGILEQLPDRRRPVDVVLLQQCGKTLCQIRWKFIHRFQQGQKKFLRARTVHRSSLPTPQESNLRDLRV